MVVVGVVSLLLFRLPMAILCVARCSQHSQDCISLPIWSCKVFLRQNVIVSLRALGGLHQPHPQKSTNRWLQKGWRKLFNFYFILLGNSFILEYWANSFILLGNSFILIFLLEENSFILLGNSFILLGNSFIFILFYVTSQWEKILLFYQEILLF